MSLDLKNIYSIGKIIPLDFKLSKLDKRLEFTFFPYSTKEILLTSLFIVIFSIILGNIMGLFSPLLMSITLFSGIIIAVISFVYPYNIYYTHKIMEYREEMLRCILHLSTYVQMGVSMERSFIDTEKNLSGTLKKQFQDINNMLKRRTVSELGDAINKYIDIWNDFNPHFVKSLRLLQLAGLSTKDDRQRLIEETIETLMINYMEMGKRSAENLSKNTNMLIGVGILLPVLSLLLLPILSVFMPQLVNPGIITFIYNVFFPAMVLLAAMSFATKRIQIDTIRIKDAAEYQPMKKYLIAIACGIAVLFAIPTFVFINSTPLIGSIDVEGFAPIILAWLLGGGIAIAIYFYCFIYVRKYRKLWNQIRDIESDVPFILQSFSTYFALNTPFENVITGVTDDYENLGFTKHPVVKSFKKIRQLLMTTKESVGNIIKKHLKKIIPSSKVRVIISQIVSFENISQDSAAKASKTIRQQILSTYKLDDYVKTLLADSVGLINITVVMLAPILCAAAAVMTYAIVKSIVFITQQLESISALFGGQTIELSLIDTANVVSPLFIELIVGVYLMEMIVILSLFQTQISTGTDFFQMLKTLKSNIVGFVIYTVLLFGGFFFINLILFQGILAG